MALLRKARAKSFIPSCSRTEHQKTRFFEVRNPNSRLDRADLRARAALVQPNMGCAVPKWLLRQTNYTRGHYIGTRVILESAGVCRAAAYVNATRASAATSLARGSSLRRRSLSCGGLILTNGRGQSLCSRGRCARTRGRLLDAQAARSCSQYFQWFTGCPNAIFRPGNPLSFPRCTTMQQCRNCPSASH